MDGWMGAIAFFFFFLGLHCVWSEKKKRMFVVSCSTQDIDTCMINGMLDPVNIDSIPSRQTDLAS
jgi:hypothetical protein